tara:strand:+ start:972 stop:1268 length:297 start_codon:yes stop_codon:yes gene_type:complete
MGAARILQLTSDPAESLFGEAGNVIATAIGGQLSQRSHQQLGGAPIGSGFQLMPVAIADLDQIMQLLGQLPGSFRPFSGLHRAGGMGIGLFSNKQCSG